MSRAYIPKALRDRVAAQAKHRCGYCMTPSRIDSGEVQEAEVVHETAKMGLAGGFENLALELLDPPPPLRHPASWRPPPRPCLRE